MSGWDIGCDPLRGRGAGAGVAEAVRSVLDRAGGGDLVLLLGAQGMDRGRDVARDWLEGRAPGGRYIA